MLVFMIMRALRSILPKLSVLLLPAVVVAAPSAGFTMREALSFPYASQLAAAGRSGTIGWVTTVGGVRNVWVARPPSYEPLQVTRYTEDDGQEITQLIFSPDGSRLVFVRGGDHDANWPAENNLAPDPAASPEQPTTALWTVSVSGGPAEMIDDGDAPAMSSLGQLAYIKDDHVWSRALTGGAPERLFFDRGKDGELRWSPDGNHLAFVSNRGDHSFVGIFTSKNSPLIYLAPSTGSDSSPRWSPDGSQLAFVRVAGDGGPPEPVLSRTPHPWSVWIASTADGTGHARWRSPETLAGSYPEVEGQANLLWMADRIIFLSYLDDWPHLYSLPAAGGPPTLLTPGPFMVEHVAESADRRSVIYDANTGTTAGDDARRHVFRVPIDRAAPVALTSGETLEWTPVGADDDHVAYVAAGAKDPPRIGVVSQNGAHRALLHAAMTPADFPAARLVVPKPVDFQAADGTRLHGQLFESDGAARSASKPGVIFLHGGPPRQMMLGWHYMEYYSNAYAVNQFLAGHGFVVLAVNYRLGIGYGRGFQQPDHAGYAGAAEYQDVVAGARFLQALPAVDGSRIGSWGGSYGGYLTALALARNSDIFKAGVDLHGVHDWSRLLDEVTGKPVTRYEKGDREQALQVAWNSSPDAAIDGWKSPVLLIQGDDDRNVPFQQTIDLARRLDAHHVPYEEIVLPNEIHGFLRHASWLRADEATADFLARRLGVKTN
jgi:dipeptidyl aminopeptidase/acylaminoacyl peptidase